jgi:hypothetical protein
MKLVSLFKLCFKETHSKVRISKHLLHSFLLQNCLKQGDALSSPPFNFALEYAIRKVQKNQVGLKVNGTPQHLTYADGVNLQGDNLDIINKDKNERTP